MRQAQTLRAAAWLVLAVVAGSAGCTHNYYYGNAVPVCPEATTTVNTISPVCEVPVVGGTLFSQGGNPSLFTGAPRATRVVVSEPSDGGIPIRGGGPFASWRRSEPESSLATTRIEGALQDSSVNR
jgi:hypothetical protein